jgi:hypothetical protein
MKGHMDNYKNHLIVMFGLVALVLSGTTKATVGVNGDQVVRSAPPVSSTVKGLPMPVWKDGGGPVCFPGIGCGLQ